MAILGYTGPVNSPYPELAVRYPENISVPLFYASPKEIYTCHCTYSLGPFETKAFQFMLHGAAPVLRTDEIVISATSWKSVHIMASKSQLEFSESQNCYLATGCVINLCQSNLEGVLYGTFEILPPHDTHYI